MEFWHAVADEPARAPHSRGDQSISLWAGTRPGGHASVGRGELSPARPLGRPRVGCRKGSQAEHKVRSAERKGLKKPQLRRQTALLHSRNLNIR